VSAASVHSLPRTPVSNKTTQQAPKGGKEREIWHFS